MALRSYLPADDPNKHLEMGSEGTPGAFLDALLDVVVECRRVLAPHGSLCVELGDTYAGSEGANEAGWHRTLKPEHRTEGRMRGDTAGNGNIVGPGWPLAKSLTLIPESFRFALAYGRNPHTGRTIEPWRVRNVVRWCRPNPPVGALGDKVRPATSDIAIACMSRSRYFDLDAVREPFKQAEWSGGTSLKRPVQNDRKDAQAVNEQTQAGAPPLDHWWHNDEDVCNTDVFGQDAWHIPTHPYPGAHYATWPPALCIKPVLAMCPQRVCTTCGKPSERIVETLTPRSVDEANGGKDRVQGRNVGGAFAKSHTVTLAETQTLGWSDCGHNTWRNGHVLDPFAGSGTTGVVATGHGRDFTGIDLDPRNHDLARERIGMWLEEAPPGMATVPTKGLL